MEILIKASQFILSLSLLILVHELGHFIPAKLFKTRVDKFYLFFDPWFSLFKFKRKDTEYGIGWLPLGGYCKITGMVDESMDKEQMKQEPQPWEFRSKPAWQRLIIIIGGVSVNLIAAIVIYISMLATWGEQYLPTKNAKYGIIADTLAQEMGLRNGDKILNVNGKEVVDFSKIPMEILLNKPKSILVERNNDSVTLPIDKEHITKLIDSKNPKFIFPRFPVEVDDFGPSSPAKKAGMLKGDKIIAINANPAEFFDSFKHELNSNKGKTVKMTVVRSGKTVELAVDVTKEGMIGIMPKSFDKFLTLETKTYSVLEAIPAGTVKAYTTVVDYFKQLRLLFSMKSKAVESLGGFIAIGNVFSPTWDWYNFWSWTALISIMLAVMNLLPIPALDGGHVVFILYEMITGRKPSEKVLEYAQYVGMALILGLVLLANANDVIRLFK